MKFKSEKSRGLVAVQFLAVLIIDPGGDRTISEDVMSEFLLNLSMQAFSKSDDSSKSYSCKLPHHKNE